MHGKQAISERIRRCRVRRHENVERVKRRKSSGQVVRELRTKESKNDEPRRLLAVKAPSSSFARVPGR
jgi:hypothetical protein